MAQYLRHLFKFRFSAISWQVGVDRIVRSGNISSSVEVCIGIFISNIAPVHDQVPGAPIDVKNHIKGQSMCEVKWFYD